MTPSPTFWLNRVRDRIAQRLQHLVQSHGLGVIIAEINFRLGSEIVRNPDAAFVTVEQLKSFDVYRSPIEGAPALAIEVISPGNSAPEISIEDMFIKVHQYLDAGCKAVWVFYPMANAMVVHDAQGTREVKGLFHEDKLFAEVILSLSLPEIFDKDVTK